MEQFGPALKSFDSSIGKNVLIDTTFSRSVGNGSRSHDLLDNEKFTSSCRCDTL